MRKILLCLLVVIVCAWTANLSTSASADAPGSNVSLRAAITDFDSQVTSLKSQMGLAQLMNATVSNHKPFSQWYTGKGVLSATTADLDGDGVKELLVVYIAEGGSSGRRLNLRIYAARKGSIVSLGDVMLDEYFADDDAAIEIALVKKGKSTFIFYQGLLGAEPIWSGYFVFELKNDKIGSVCALRDAPYTAITILEKMSNVSSVSTLSSFYNRSLSGTLLFRIDGRDNVSGKYKSYRSAVVSELSAFGLASFTTDYKPRMKATSNVTRICTIRSNVNSTTKATIAVVDFTGLQGPPSTNPDANTIVVKSVTLNKTKGTITAGASGRLKATIKPANATDKTLVWSSDNEAVAIVAQDGTVTGVGRGTTYIRVKTANGKTAKCKLTVKARPKKYFAVLIAESSPGTTVEGTSSQKDIYAMNEMLNLLEFNGQKYDIVYDLNPSGSRIEQLINDQIAKMEKTDTLLFYISAHGWHDGSITLANNTSLPAAALKAMLDKHTGPKILLMDSCFSGAVIGKSLMIEAAAFDREIARLFGPTIGTKGTGTDGDLPSSGEFATAGYSVITACSSQEFSHAQRGEYGYFTRALCEAGGWNMKAGKKMGFKASSSSKVTLAQVYKYIKSKVKSYWIPDKLMFETQTVQYYGNPNTVLFRR